MKKLQCKIEKKSIALWEDGYATSPFLLTEHINHLIQLFYKFHNKEPEGFYATTHAQDKNLRKELGDNICEIVNSRIHHLFTNAEVLGGAFISKNSGNKGILPLHQDWNIVDEKEARSYNLWIPLVDVSSQNGAMKILPKSHRKQENYRGPGIPSLFKNIDKEVNQHMITLPMKAGEALIYDHALWHSSPVNHTKQLRICIVLGIVAKDTSLKHYTSLSNQIAEYNAYPEFYLEYDN